MADKNEKASPSETNSIRDSFEREVTTDLDDKTADKPRGLALHTRIAIGLTVGVVAGVVANQIFGGSDPRLDWFIRNFTEPIGQLFLRSLLMIVVPLVFSSLVVGVAGIGDIRRLGRIGVKSFVYTLVISAISVVIGLTLTNTIRPGERVDPETSARLQQRYNTEASKKVEDTKKMGGSETPLMQVVTTIIPSNPITAAASETPNMLHLMFFALIIGVAATLVPTTTAAPLLKGLQALYEISAKIIEIIMKIAPFAIACLLFTSVARFGLDLLQGAGMVCGDGDWRSRAAHVRRLLSFSLFPFAHQPGRILPAHQDRHAHRFLDIIFQRDAAHGAASGRGKSGCATRNQ
ncbi:MAG: cation:dicarboxylase symporter family transporter [Pyrinomonadaceae bacterium]